MTESITEQKYIFPNNFPDITGICEEEEKTCRAMIIAGMEWFDNNPLEAQIFKEPDNCIDYCFAMRRPERLYTKNNNDPINMLVSAMKNIKEAKEYKDFCGAILHICLKHVLHAHEIGWEKYIKCNIEWQKKKEE